MSNPVRRLRRRQAERRSHSDYVHHRKEAERTGGSLCALVTKDGRPHYFVVPKGATDEQIAAKAFEIREGRPMTPQELLLQYMAERRLAGRLQELETEGDAPRP